MNGSYHGRCTGVYDHVSGLRYCNHEDGSLACKRFRAELTSCLEKYGCSPVVSKDKETCSYSKCSTQVNRVLGCEASCRHVLDTVKDRCTVKDLRNRCPTPPFWEKVALFFYSLVGAIAIVFIVYNIFAWRKSKSTKNEGIDYYQIQ